MNTASKIDSEESIKSMFSIGDERAKQIHSLAVRELKAGRGVRDFKLTRASLNPKTQKPKNPKTQTPDPWQIGKHPRACRLRGLLEARTQSRPLFPFFGLCFPSKSPFI